MTAGKTRSAPRLQSTALATSKLVRDDSIVMSLLLSFFATVMMIGLVIGAIIQSTRVDLMGSTKGINYRRSAVRTAVYASLGATLLISALGAFLYALTIL